MIVDRASYGVRSEAVQQACRTNNLRAVLESGAR